MVEGGDVMLVCVAFTVLGVVLYCCGPDNSHPPSDEEAQRSGYRLVASQPSPQPSSQSRSRSQQDYEGLLTVNPRTFVYEWAPQSRHQTHQPSREQQRLPRSGTQTEQYAKTPVRAPLYWTPPEASGSQPERSKVQPGPPKTPPLLPQTQKQVLRQQSQKHRRQPPPPELEESVASTPRRATITTKPGSAVPPRIFVVSHPLISYTPITRENPEQQRRDISSNSQQDGGYSHLRDEAKQASSLMGECSRRSKEAFRSGNRVGGKALLFELKQHKTRMDRLNAQASDLIYAGKNLNSSPGEYDLHGLYVPEAKKRVQQALVEAHKRGYAEIRIITGQGLHSEGGTPRIKPAIEKLLAKQGIAFKEDPGNAGVLKVALRLRWSTAI